MRIALVASIAVAPSCVAAATASAALPDGRAYELVSPSDKHGVDVVAEASRTHAAAAEAPGLPAAVAFSALGGFADVRGTGIGTEYVSQRTGAAGTSGWATHAITPPQEPLSYFAILLGLEPLYQGDMSADLTHGVFGAWSALTDAPNVARVPNLYVREDLRTPGAGRYRLLTDAVAPLPPPALGAETARYATAAASPDFEHVLFETRQNLTADASGDNVKLYKADGAQTRLVAAGPGCPGMGGTEAQAPCGAAGHGVFRYQYAERTLSDDGSRTILTAPVSDIGGVLDSSGAASKLLQLDDRGTVSTADDALIQLNASEASVPGPTGAARYEIASADGSRVFFLSGEQLTDGGSGGGLYLWERQPVDEVQSLAIDAAGGTFTLTAHGQPSAGTGTIASGSTGVTAVSGSFSAGQAISGPGIPGGATIAAVPSRTTLTLSAPATASGAVALRASVDATTAPLAHDATAAQVQGALEALRVIGSGNVSVSGGPGGAGGATPYLVTFTGALAGVNVEQLTADGSALSGGGASATVTTTIPIRNLTRIVATASPSLSGVLGGSRDGHRVYFASPGAQLVSGGPAVRGTGLYSWQDADGTPGGTLSFIGDIRGGDVAANANQSQWNSAPKVSRVTPDGRVALFEASDGSGLKPRYVERQGCIGAGSSNPNNTTGGCSEVYVYRADGSTPTDPNLVCASCIPSGAIPASSAWINSRSGGGATLFSSHLSHALSDDGRRVFFSTSDALVPQDANGRFDAYEYDVPSGTLHLLSTGRDGSDSYFLDASDDGRDVYLATRERLVGWDRDNAIDLYDARVGGGFPEPVPTLGCGGDACQGSAPEPPGAAALGSAAARGAGNVRSARRHRGSRTRCRHGFVRRRVHGKRRCVRRKTRHRRRHRHAGRRAR